MNSKKSVLFVCLGNICRSPSAEGIFQHLIDASNLGHLVSCDSAGIIGAHAGGRADSRMREHAARRGVELTSTSRQIDPDVDFDAFDLIIGMDSENMSALRSLSRSSDDEGKLRLMTDFCTHSEASCVPDPYYGGAAGFELVLDILEEACEGLLGEFA